MRGRRRTRGVGSRQRDASAEDRLRCLKVDVTERKRTEALLAGEKRVLEMIAAGESLPVVLDALCRTVEAQREGLHCSILVVEGDQLRHGAAPEPARGLRGRDGRPRQRRARRPPAWRARGASR